MIFRRRGRFDDVIQRQLDLFEQDHLDVIEEVVERMEAYNRADRDEAEELYGDYVDAVETGTELLADIRDSYARMLEEGIDELYEEEFNRAVLKRWPPFASRSISAERSVGAAALTRAGRTRAAGRAPAVTRRGGQPAEAPRLLARQLGLIRAPADDDEVQHDSDPDQGDREEDHDSTMPEMVCAGEGGAYLGITGRTTGQRAEALELVDEDVLVAADPLEAAAREQQRLAAHDGAVRLVDGRRDDQVHLAMLVLEQHEDDAVRGRRPLARDGQAGDLERAPCGTR